MAIYVQLLSAGLMADATKAVAPGELVSLVRERRDQMLAPTGPSGPSAERSLAYDVKYDCALIRLCAAVGIHASPASFGQPRGERLRLERALADAGVHLGTADPCQYPGPDELVPPSWLREFS